MVDGAQAHLVTQFPGWERRVEYWHIDDVEQAPSAVALNSIANQIDWLITQIHPVDLTQLIATFQYVWRPAERVAAALSSVVNSTVRW